MPPMTCADCKWWSEMVAQSLACGPVTALCLNPDSPKHQQMVRSGCVQRKEGRAVDDNRRCETRCPAKKQPKLKAKLHGAGPAIRAARQSLGLTQAELAVRCGRGWNQAAVSRYERGAAKPSVPQLCKIADALEMNFTYDGTTLRFSPRETIVSISQGLLDTAAHRL